MMAPLRPPLTSEMEVIHALVGRSKKLRRRKSSRRVAFRLRNAATARVFKEIHGDQQCETLTCELKSEFTLGFRGGRNRSIVHSQGQRPAILGGGFLSRCFRWARSLNLGGKVSGGESDPRIKSFIRVQLLAS